jgi:hypothetical protein
MFQEGCASSQTHKSETMVLFIFFKALRVTPSFGVAANARKSTDRL